MRCSISVKTQILIPAPGPVFIQKFGSRSCSGFSKNCRLFPESTPAPWSPLPQSTASHQGTIKHFFPPMLLVFAMKYCTKMPCPLPHNHYWCLLSSPICLPHLLICTCLISSPIACPPSSVLRWCLLRFCFFLLYILNYLWLHVLKSLF